MAESDRAAVTVDAIRALDRAAAKGIVHRNNAARRKSRLMRQLVKLGLPAPTASRTTAKGKKGAASAPAPAPTKPDKKGKK